MRSRTLFVQVWVILAVMALVLSACTPAEEAVEPPPEVVEEEAVEPPPEVVEEEAPEEEEAVHPAAERGLYLVSEFREAFPDHAALEQQLLEILAADPVPVAVEVTEPIRIAYFLPSLEISDAWARLDGALRGRLTDLNIPFEITTFLTRPDDHTLQATHVESVLADPGRFDYAVFAPTEWEVQKANVRRLSAVMPTLAYNVANPFYDLWGTDESPLSHLAFDHETGAQLLCEWVVQETGGEGTVALLRFVRGVVDELRSTTFGDCVEQNSNMEVVIDLETEGDRERAFTAANTALTAHPNITFMHAASTAITLGALAALRERDAIQDVLLNGWGGGSDELAELKAGNLNVTVFRVIDDWGASGAEIIKMHLEGRANEIPGVVSPTMKIIDHRWSAAEIDAETEWAFRYSGEGR
jgi:autoinducer 2-binding periplasmic protein LuxP